jgi:hypothetical protein
LQGTGIPAAEQQVTVHLETNVGECISKNYIKLLFPVIIDEVNILVMVIDHPQHVAVVYPLVGEESKVKGKAKASIHANRFIACKIQRGSFLLYMLKGREYQTLRSGR